MILWNKVFVRKCSLSPNMLASVMCTPICVWKKNCKSLSDHCWKLTDYRLGVKQILSFQNSVADTKQLNETSGYQVSEKSELRLGDFSVLVGCLQRE